jgi:hypothetical protein
MGLDDDRVRRHTAAAVVRQIDEDTVSRLVHYASADAEAIGRRVDELNREWDTDRAIELEASLVGLVGLALGVWVRPALLALPALVGSAVFLHALSGRYPMLPVFRRIGLRTAREINRERYALKTLRGDFEDMEPAGLTPSGAKRIQ